MGFKDLFKKKDPRYTSLLAFIAVAIADGKFTESEKLMIEMLAERIGLSKKDVDFCLLHPDKIKPNVPKTQEDKIQCISGMVAVMIADGEADPKEIDLVKAMANAYGIDPSFVDGFIPKKD